MLLVGIALSFICQKLNIPKIIGYLFTGVILGQFVLNLIDSSILNISSELRQIALIIILIKAGLSLNLKDLKKVGRPALLMSFVPALFEITAFILFAPLLLGVTRLEAALMGAVLGAVSPAVVVPKMVQLIEHKYGTKKAIPELILGGATLDDVFVIVLFTSFLGMATGDEVNVFNFANIPISIVLGILIGLLFGLLLSIVFNYTSKIQKHIRNSVKVILIVAASFALMAIQYLLEGFIAISGLLAIMAMGIMIRFRCKEDTVNDVSNKFGKIWLVAEIFLFVLVGASVNITYAFNAGPFVILMIFIALIFRSIGVILSLIKTSLNAKERLFTVIAYLPKATVQAAIGGIPLAMGLGVGELILSVAVIAILVTAPLGAFGMDLTYKKLLTKDDNITHSLAV